MGLCRTLATVAGLALAAGSADAAILYDAALTSPGNSLSGWYLGTGNPNGGFTIDSENGIEIGLRAKYRQSGSVINTPSNVYTVSTGVQNAGHALWNYEFAIDLNPDGAAGPNALTLGDIAAALTITNVGTGATVTIDPLTYWGDNYGYGPNGKEVPAAGSDWSAQNSENPLFGDFPLAGYDPWVAATYRFDLTVSDQQNNVLATDSIVVRAVPEPTTLTLLGAGLAAISALRKRRKV